MRECVVRDLGRMSYSGALAVQQRIAAERKQGLGSDHLLFVEHPHVVTIGRNGHEENVLAPEETLRRAGIELYETDRGGDVTYHGPGQLVGYPIVDLRGEWPGKRGPHLGPVDFVRLLEEALIRTCADFGVMAKRIPKCTGVWTLGDEPTRDDKTVTNGAPNPSAIREKKLAAIGVHVSQAVTSHGFALNVTTDLGDFDWIVPCGIRDRGVTSLKLEADARREPTMDRAIHATARNFGRVFQRQMLWCDSIEQLLAPSGSRI